MIYELLRLSEFKDKVNLSSADNIYVKFTVLFLLIFLVSCEAPLQGDITVKVNDEESSGGTSSGTTAGGTTTGGTTTGGTTTGGTTTGGTTTGGTAGGATSLNIPFSTGTETSYIFNNATEMELASNLVRLKNKTHIDQSNTVMGFAGGTKNGVVWDIANGVLRLNSTSNLNEHSIDWTPQVVHVVGYYKMNEATYTGAANQLIDSGPGSFHGESNGPLINSIGKLRNAGTFDGVSHVGVADKDYFENHAKYSIAVWVKPTNLNGNAQGIVSKRIDFNDNHTFSLFFYGSNQLYVDIDGANDRFASLTEFENNKWYHIIVTFDGTEPPANRVRVYVNGALDRTASETSTIIPNYSAPLRIGSIDGSNLYNFQGQIDEVVLWKEMLTYSEVMYIYEKQSYKITGEFISRVMDSVDTDSKWTYLSPKTTIPFSKELPGTNGSETITHYPAVAPNLMNGLQAYWKFEDTSPATTKDSIGSIDGTRSGAIDLGDLRGPFNYANAFYGGAIEFNNTFLNNMPAFSIGGWISPIFLKNFVGGNNVGIIGKTGVVEIGLKNGYLCARSHVDNNENCTSNKLNIGEWTHFMVTGDATTFNLYVNGKYITNITHAGADFGASASNFIMGSKIWDASDNFYIGLMDEMAVWNRALTAAEVTNLYRRGANTLQYHVRSCAAADCSDQDALLGQGWLGPDNNSYFYFSENHNYQFATPGVPAALSKTEALKLAFRDFPAVTVNNNRYFQYKAVFRSNDSNSLCDYGSGAVMCSPELKSMTIGPSYSTKLNTITNTAAIGAPFTTFDLNSFAETLGPNGCAGFTNYTISVDGTNFYYYNGSNWVIADGTLAETSDAWTVAATLPAFPIAVGTGTLQVKTFLNSDGYDACEVDNLFVSGTN